MAKASNSLASNASRTGGYVRTDGQVTAFVETLVPGLPSAGLRVEL